MQSSLSLIFGVREDEFLNLILTWRFNEVKYPSVISSHRDQNAWLFPPPCGWVKGLVSLKILPPMLTDLRAKRHRVHFLHFLWITKLTNQIKATVLLILDIISKLSFHFSVYRMAQHVWSYDITRFKNNLLNSLSCSYFTGRIWGKVIWYIFILSFNSNKQQKHIVVKTKKSLSLFDSTHQSLNS